jgi:hypothetical protein
MSSSTLYLSGNYNYPVGTGGFQDLTGGTPQPANFYGMAGWWTVPTSWYTRVENGQIFVSPNSDFSRPQYAVKINVDGCWVFQDMMARTLAIEGARMTFPPVREIEAEVTEEGDLLDGEQYMSGVTELSAGATDGTISGLGLEFVPSKVFLQVAVPDGGSAIRAYPIKDSITEDGFDYTLDSEIPLSDAYQLQYLIL